MFILRETPGLVVKGVDSWPFGREFESQYKRLVKISHVFLVKIELLFD